MSKNSYCIFFHPNLQIIFISIYMLTTFLKKMTSVSPGPVFFYHHVDSNMLILKIYKEVTCSVSLFPKDSNGPIIVVIEIKEIPGSR